MPIEGIQRVPEAFSPDGWSDLHQEKLSGARCHLRPLVRHQIHKQSYTHSRLSKKISKHVVWKYFRTKYKYARYPRMKNKLLVCKY